MAAPTFAGHTERKKGSLGEIKWDGVTGFISWSTVSRTRFFVVMQDSPSARMHVITTIRRIIRDALEK